MGVIVERHLPCTDTKDCGSSDAMNVYEDGSTFCFSCSKRTSGYVKRDRDVFNHIDSEGNELAKGEEYDGKPLTSAVTQDISSVDSYPTRGFSERAVKKSIAAHFGVKVAQTASKEITAHFYPYSDQGSSEIYGYKVRRMPKDFSFLGKLKGLFGANKVNMSDTRVLVITEGEMDAMSVAQAWFDKYDKIYPVVSVSSASGTKELLRHREWIRKFDKVVLWFDNDEPGREAVSAAARIIGYDKTFDVVSTFKDASECLTTSPSSGTLLNQIYSAKQFSPVGIVSSGNTWDSYKKASGEDYVPYPEFMKDLNSKNYGRKLGSITMVTSGTGMGKTSWIKEDQYHLLRTRPAEERIGVLSLEESIAEAVGGIMALEANKRIQLPDVAMTDAEERSYWEATMADDRFMFLDHQGSMNDSSLIDKMEYMCLAGCKYLYLDHVTIAVGGEADVNTAIDNLMSDLLKLAKRYNIWVGVISHLRKTGNNQKSFEEGAVPSEDDLKGSGALKQVPMQIFAISRNKMEKDETKRNTSFFWVLKDRFTGRTGFVGAFIFDYITGRLRRIDVEADSLSAFEPIPKAE